MRYLVIALLVMSLLLAGCAHTSVKDINENTEKYLGKKVVVSGKVVAPMDLGSMSGFTLKQDKNSIMVSSEDVPEAGEEVIVKGVVVKGLFSQQYIFADSVR
jgi:hypothetical protein